MPNDIQKDLEKVLAYMHESEEAHYEEWFNSAEAPKGEHIYESVLAVESWLKTQNKNPYKVGDKVRYKDGDTRTFQVYAVYGPTMVSLGLHDYPDTEQDEQVHINSIEPIKN